MSTTTADGTLADGARYRYEVPDAWNGVLLLYSRPVPVAPGEPPWQEGNPIVTPMVQRGYAVAGAANTIFWPLEACFANQPMLVEAFTTEVGTPTHTVGVGLSIGGIITAGLIQHSPGLLSGALATCGNLAGAVAVHNRELDIAFVVKTLLAADAPLDLVRIGDPDANLRLAVDVLDRAQTTADGRARLGLAAAVGNIPGWYDPAAAEPEAGDHAGRLRNQIAWFEQPGFLVYFQAREQVERQAGGNPSWNTGVDYSYLVDTSINADQVQALYAEAGLDLDDDLERLAAAGRLEADPAAVSYLEDHIVFDGDLHGAPVLTMHTAGDGLVTVDNEHAYADVVRWAGHQDHLAQLDVHRGGHCSFTTAELATGLDVLIERLESGVWPDLAPQRLNELASHERQGSPPAFYGQQPPPFPRPHDVRHVRARTAQDPVGGHHEPA